MAGPIVKKKEQIHLVNSIRDVSYQTFYFLSIGKLKVNFVTARPHLLRILSVLHPLKFLR